MKTSLPRKLNFATEDKITELIRQAGGTRDSAARQAIEHAIGMGRGECILILRKSNI